MSNKKKIVFIIGMGRCGTSLLSNCLVDNGFSIGKRTNKSKNWQNPKGYFENDSFTIMHDKLLYYNGCKWNNIVKDKMEYTKEHVNEYRNIIKSEFSNVDKILIKDPRITFFTNFLKEVCDELYDFYFIFCTRNEEECCKSLSKAQKMTYEKSKILYETTHKYYSEEFLKIDHNDILFRNSKVLNTISKFCNFEIKKDTSSIVDLNLYRNKKNNEEKL